MPNVRHYLLPHRLQELAACCPRSFLTYASLHLDTIRKILNHLFIGLLGCNIMLFLSSWGTTTTSSSLGVGLNHVTLLSTLLLLRTLVVYGIINHAHPALPPTEFHVGVTLGLTVGGSVVAFAVASAYAYPASAASFCDGLVGGVGGSSSSNSRTGYDGTSNQTSFTYPGASTAVGAALREYCLNRGIASTIWFWSSLIFWINFCASLLLAVGRRDVALAIPGGGQYEPIPGSGAYDDPDLNPSQGRFGGGSGSGGGRPNPPPAPASFVGDYAQIPEIRSHDENNRSTSSTTTIPSTALSSGSSSSETSRIVLSI